MAPNKIIFQLGVLAFCVTAVFLGLQNVSLMDTISRSFIVFVGVILTVMLALSAGSMFLTKKRVEGELHGDGERKTARPDAAKRTEKPAPAK
jgi:hypothetical protein